MKSKNYFYLFLYILILRGSFESIFIAIKNFLSNKPIVQQPTPQYFINYLNKNISNIISDCNDYVLVDFGCGEGLTLQKLNFNKSKIGIEINKEIYNLAVKKNKNNNIQFINDDICNYNFNKNTILYMYEPLWLCKDYLVIYNKFFKNILKNNIKIYIIYLTGIGKYQLHKKYFEKFDFKLLHKHTYGSIIINRTIYIYSN